MSITTQILQSKNQNFIEQTTSFINNGFSSDTNGGVQFPLQRGVPYQSRYAFKVIPQPINTTCVAQSILISAAGYIPLNSQNTASTTSQGSFITKSIPYSGEPIFNNGVQLSQPFTGSHNCIQLDCERNISINIIGGNTVGNVVVTIAGWDYRGVAVTEQLTIFQGSMPIPPIYSSKVYSIIGSIYFSATPHTNISIGNGNKIGLPYLLVAYADCISSSWNNVVDLPPLADIEIGNNWRLSNTPSNTSGPARGAVNLPSAANGTSQLIVDYLVYGSDSETNANISNLYYTDVTLYGISKNVSGEYVIPYLTKYDLLGVQYPGDMSFYTAYTAALAM